MQDYYEAAVGVVSDTINKWLESMDVEFQLEFLDECVATVDIVEMIKNPEQTGIYFRLLKAIFVIEIILRTTTMKHCYFKNSMESISCSFLRRLT